MSTKLIGSVHVSVSCLVRDCYLIGESTDCWISVTTLSRMRFCERMFDNKRFGNPSGVRFCFVGSFSFVFTTLLARFRWI